jgi:hypothetical protein
MSKKQCQIFLNRKKATSKNLWQQHVSGMSWYNGQKKGFMHITRHWDEVFSNNVEPDRVKTCQKCSFVSKCSFGQFLNWKMFI